MWWTRIKPHNHRQKLATTISSRCRVADLSLRLAKRASFTEKKRRSKIDKRRSQRPSISLTSKVPNRSWLRVRSISLREEISRQLKYTLRNNKIYQRVSLRTSTWKNQRIWVPMLPTTCRLQMQHLEISFKTRSRSSSNPGNAPCPCIPATITVSQWPSRSLSTWGTGKS